jgi:hypothetical protein
VKTIKVCLAILFLMVGAIGTTCGTAHATLFSETTDTDAGSLIGTAIDVGDVLQYNGFAGTIAANDVDVWGFQISKSGICRALTNFPYNPQLFLFNASGYGIVGNDNIAGAGAIYYDSYIEAMLTPGTYYLAISRSNMDPLDSLGRMIFTDNSTGPQTPTGAGPLAGWSGNVQFGSSPDAYKLYIDAVPIPAAVWLFGSGLAGLVALKYRRCAWDIARSYGTGG